MPTPLDQNFMVGFQQGANIVNNAQANAMRTMSGIQQMVARKLQMEQAAEMFPYQLESLRMEKEMNALKMEEAMRLKKIQLRNQGTLTALAQMAAEVPPGSPNFIPAMQRVAYNNPDVMLTPQWQTLTKSHYDALDQKNKVDQLEIQRQRWLDYGSYQQARLKQMDDRINVIRETNALRMTNEQKESLELLRARLRLNTGEAALYGDFEKAAKELDALEKSLGISSKATVFDFDPTTGKLVGQGVNPDWQPSTPATNGMPNNVGPWEIPPNQ